MKNNRTKYKLLRIKEGAILNRIFNSSNKVQIFSGLIIKMKLQDRFKQLREALCLSALVANLSLIMIKNDK